MASLKAINNLLSVRQPERRPTAEQAARRLVILRHIVVYALASPDRGLIREMLNNLTEEDQQTLRRETDLARDEIWGYIHSSGLWSDMSPWERDYARSTMVTMTHRQQVDASWRMEAVQVLMWALGFVQDLPEYGVQADPNLLGKLSVEPIDVFIKSADLRPRSEIDKARDVAELWGRRSRARQLIEDGVALYPDPKLRAAGLGGFNGTERTKAEAACQDLEVNGKPYRDLEAPEWLEVESITRERQIALNWLCGCAPLNRWNESLLDLWMAC